MNKTLILLAVSLFAFMACQKEETIIKEPEEPKELLEVLTKKDINATYANYQYFSFADGDTVPFADSSTTNWDIAFKGTSIILNGGTSGSGDAGVIIEEDSLFSELTTAPSTGYAQDAASGNGIPTGSGNGWYNYNSSTHLITPLAGKVFVIRTADNKYAKMQIVNYYKGAPASPDAVTDTSKYYAIRYVYQPDGSTNLKFK